MPWNEPGGNGKNNDPWGGNKNQGPPALDKVFSDLLKKINGLFKGKQGQWQPNQKHGIGLLFSIFFGIILVVWFLSGLFIVNPAEEAVVLRFGKYSEILQPGLHWIARFVDTKYLVDVQKIYSFSLQEDYLTKSAEQNDLIQVDSGKKADDSLDQSKNLVFPVGKW